MKKLLLLFLFVSSILSAQTYTNNTSTPLEDAPSTDACGSGATTPGVTTSAINIPIIDQVADPNLVVFSLAIDHTWVSDLVVEIQAPTLSSCALLKRAAATAMTTNTACGSGSNLIAANILNFSSAYATLFVPSGTSTVDNPGGNFAPSGQLPTIFPTTATLCNLNSFLTGLEINGDWGLTITDYGGGDTGALASWAIAFAPGSLANTNHGLIFSSAISVMQNPFNEKLNLKANTNNLDTLTFDVFSIEGKLLYSNSLASFVDNKLSIDTSGWNSGTYVIVPVKNGKRSQALKIIKE